MQEATEAITGASVKSPKTILGFFAIVFGLLCSVAAVLVWTFARTPALHGLIVPVVIFVGSVVLMLLIGVFITAWIDPTILMLGQVSGEIYIQNRKLKLGDSTSGEYTEHVISPAQAGNAPLLALKLATHSFRPPTCSPTNWAWT
jgi:hypothetical protein